MTSHPDPPLDPAALQQLPAGELQDKLWAELGQRLTALGIANERDPAGGLVLPPGAWLFLLDLAEAGQVPLSTPPPSGTTMGESSEHDRNYLIFTREVLTRISVLAAVLEQTDGRRYSLTEVVDRAVHGQLDLIAAEP